ncbi:terminase gpA endonuclease subunit [Roseiconus lacunae]|uniref:terminase gpA endonuclease subunit n=1 Tax=Roseiconus lacunae TaxID=2605694 RepID=UPI0011F17E1E|nr:terminase gpA endonuclease subunit [Roseiconus lacunae]
MTDHGYDQHKQRAAERQKEQSQKGRDIGSIPPPKNKQRRDRCRKDLPLYLKTYYPETFALDWSPNHIAFLADVQNVILHGGRKCVMMPRGSGKTQMLTRATNWGISYGYRNFIALIAAEESAAEELAEILIAEWETNQRLAEDFPEIAIPIRALEGINQRAKGQTCGGKRTHITWTTKEIVFPAVEGSAAAGAVIKCAGILGRIRGMAKVNAQSGKTQRPDCFLIDDFQTDASARSDVQCSTRELTLNGAVMGLGGPGKKIAGLASSTIIRHGDSASRLSNRTLYPQWRADVFKLVEKWPTAKTALEKLETYLEIRAGELAQGIEDHPKATAFYRKHQKTIEKGGRASWEARKYPHEISALQHAFGLRSDNPDTFDAEYQNNPKDNNASVTGIHIPSSDEIVIKQYTHRRGTVPDDATRMFCGIDVQMSSLWWYIVAVTEDFTGYVVDRGVWPEQPALGPYFTLNQVEQGGRTMMDVTGDGRPEGALRIALETLTRGLFDRDVYTADRSRKLKLELCLIDDGYLTRVVQSFCRSSPLAVLPAKGVGVTSKSTPWAVTRRKPGERRGPGWKMPTVIGTDQSRHVMIDTNDWATRMAMRWATPIGTPGSWSLYKAPHALNRMLSDQLSAETATETYGRGRKLFEWSLKPGCENHWKDAERMAAVAASIAGITIPGDKKTSGGKPKSIPGISNKAQADASANKKRKPTLAERRAAMKNKKRDR